MGEAKRRRAKDPTYGRPKRGLVISPPIEIDGSRLFARSSQLDSQELRFALLLWDRIVWPSSRVIHFASGPDETFLEQEGILSRPDFTVWGDAAQGILAGQINAFSALEANEPGLWSLAEGGNSLLVRDSHFVPSNRAQIELYRAIPIPTKDVPLADILEFKLKRDPELLSLRSEVDRIAAIVKSSPDSEAEFRRQYSYIDEACANLFTVAKEWQFPVRLTNLKMNYEVRPGELVAGALAGILGQQVVLTSTQAAIAGVAGAGWALRSAIKITFDGFEWRGMKPRLGPYKYVHDFHREVF